MKNLLLLFVCLWLSMAVYGQSGKYQVKDYPNKPVWIDMIRDTTVNYFETEKAFNTYFQYHEKPGGEEEETKEREWLKTHRSDRDERAFHEKNELRMDVKKYERWKQKMQPYIQPDGTILTPSQRLQIWQSQKTNK
jgi:hypothetical protein